jgi:hypothetical protein
MVFFLRLHKKKTADKAALLSLCTEVLARKMTHFFNSVSNLLECSIPHQI